MEKIVRFTGKAVPLLFDNVDTDQIIPGGGIFASGTIDLEHCGRNLFADWRYLADGSTNRNFILNQPRWDCSTILLAGENFGCGSSREWATTALRGYGFRVVIAAGFSNIFFSNCFRNGLLPIVLGKADVIELGRLLECANNPELTVDLEAQTVECLDGFIRMFTIPPIMRRMALEGADEGELAARHAEEIAEFRLHDGLSRPWIY